MYGQSLKRQREDELDSDCLAHDSKVQKIYASRHAGPVTFSVSTTDLDQSLRVRAPTLTPVDSEDEDGDSGNGTAPGAFTGGLGKMGHGHRLPMLQLDINNRPTKQQQMAPSPIPHALLNHSLTINGIPTTTSSHGYFPAVSMPVPNQSQSVPNVMDEDMLVHQDGPPAVRLPSPVSDNGDAIMGDEDTEMGNYPSHLRSHVPNARPSSALVGASQHPVQAPSMEHAPTCNEGQRRRSPLVMGYRADCDKCRCKVPGHYSHIRRP
ncbi:hypothetical protein N7462_006262 [Penicillium macrosclerotiorum]|uniref:uncharacterized protein n=1 Tax=Penicillium macrosclerotiorum TaxID=303699 RepID=UPI002546A6B7|nr:uncharacterized protein N7462_006262 [Penicillium macrosclerotiorum]KAJ5683097.1 hypothetical protein N7462_006262 [Penicillium macrosclerotiorum]